MEEAARQKNIRNGTITGFTTGGVAALTTLEFEPGLVGHDQMCIRDRAQAVRPAPIKEQMAEAAKQAGKENAARSAPAKAKEARNDR